jgi:hypothetical protein
VNRTGRMVIAASLGLLTGLQGCGKTPGAAGDSNGGANAPSAAKHACRGQNACKGQGGCKTAAHACKGQNACKGQGGCNMS